MLSKFLAVIAGLILCASAAAADFAPMQPAHAGNWFDPAQSGSGFDVLPYPVPHTDGSAFVTFYNKGTATEAPTWYAAQLDWHGPGPITAPMYASADSGAAIVGSVTFTASGGTCSELHAVVTFTGEAPKRFDLVPLIQPNAATCFQCGGFSPMPSACY
jgi:hypothetical protein